VDSVSAQGRQGVFQILFLVLHLIREEEANYRVIYIYSDCGLSGASLVAAVYFGV